MNKLYLYEYQSAFNTSSYHREENHEWFSNERLRLWLRSLVNHGEARTCEYVIVYCEIPTTVLKAVLMYKVIFQVVSFIHLSVTCMCACFLAWPFLDIFHSSKDICEVSPFALGSYKMWSWLSVVPPLLIFWNFIIVLP